MDAARFAPAGAGERLAHIDVIRGLALFGVLLMNTQYHFRGPAERFALDRHPFEGFWNGVADSALRLLVEGKAMTLFSLLFGVGLALQLQRKEAAGGGFWGFAWRRMGALFGFGLLHVALLWYGDILTIYAFDGVLLFAFLRRKTRTLHIWLAALLGLLAVAVFVLVTLQLQSPTPLDAERAKAVAAASARADFLLEGYLQPGWWDCLVFRIQHYLEDVPGFLEAVILAFLNLFLGLVFWRSGVLRTPAEHTGRLRRAALAFLPLGFASGLVLLFSRNIVQFALHEGGIARSLVFVVAASQVFHFLLLAIGYGALLLLLWQRPAWQRALGTLAPVGRMALTNYLAQSLVMTAIFYGWGLGLYGKVGPAAGTALCTLVFAAQVVASQWWLKRFQFGPVEWLWRCLGYAERQPFRIAGHRPTAVAAAAAGS